MARTYRTGPAQRVGNTIFRWIAERGLGADFRFLMTVRGRRSGELRSVPVDAIEVSGERWLVAAYGVVSWVHNVRAADLITLTRGRVESTWRPREVGPAEAVPVIRAYLTAVPVTRPYWDVTPDASEAEIAAEVVRHPVFRLEPVQD